MTVFINGEFLPEEQAGISILDRSFCYGDGLFEAILVRHGKLFRWPQYIKRLERSAEFFQIPLPWTSDQLLDIAVTLITQNNLPDAILRLQLSRGSGARGYAPTGNETPVVVMSVHPVAARESLRGLRWKLTLASVRVPVDELLVQHKTCSRIVQVLAAAEARQRGADEALLVNTDGEITEGSSSNFFWIDRDVVCTTPSKSVLPGVTRAVVLEICAALEIPFAEQVMRPDKLFPCEGAFLTLTSRGVVQAGSIDGAPVQSSKLTTRIQKEFEALLERECA